ncbi:MAG: dihydroorotate dehydrogenase electron transfer subunit [Armatimonadetes bacterium]|nr:dihydroorotate dehydrogenase electron transfer subunit [Armatimonadota bacterium]
MGEHVGAWQGLATITDRRDLAPGYFALDVHCPAIAAGAQPGGFAHILVEGRDLCLRRPISFFGVEGDIVTLVVGIHGAGTAWLAARQPGDSLDLLGPLGGRTLSLAAGASRVALVGGGVGIPPLRFLAARCVASAPQLVAFIGARSAERLLGAAEFAALGCQVVVSTDDGSAGFRGTVVSALDEYAEQTPVDQVIACGPTPMMRAAAEWAARRGLPCQVCLEARMACGVGACLSCVIETTAPGFRQYQRVCHEGPVFDGAEVVWERLSPLCSQPAG